MTNALIDEIKKLAPEEKIEIKTGQGKSSDLVVITRVHHSSSLCSCFRAPCKVYFDELMKGEVELMTESITKCAMTWICMAFCRHNGKLNCVTKKISE